MRDISTDDLIQTLIIKTEAAERAAAIYKLHPTGQLAKAQNAREREKKDALRALRTHLKDIELGLRQTRTVKMPPGFVNLRGKIPARTINALKAAGVYAPETRTVEELLQLPGVGIQGLASIAHRAYAPHTLPVNWPELRDD